MTKNSNNKKAHAFKRAAALITAVLMTALVFTGCPHKPKEEPKVLPKPEVAISYTVEHLQQNIADNEYTLKETETGTGTTDTMTQAEAKNYTGFTAQEIIQAKIKADGSTVVQIKYSRNIIALKLNLTGGTTTTPLTDGEGGIKLLKGKYGAKVELKNLEKTGNIFDKWTPELPSTFPASSPDTTYAASWTNQCRITVKGDERTSIPSDHIKIDLAPAKTWNDIKTDVQSKVSLKTEWQGGDYKVYEWRLDDENGTKLTDDYQIKSHITVYAVTNYAKFKTNSTKTKIELTSDGKGYTGAAPKGKIIIPDGITEIGGDLFTGAFKDCTEISSIKLPQTLTKIGKTAFAGCTGLTSISLPANLTEIDWYAFSDCTGLTSISMPANLTKIGLSAFRGCAGLTSISLPTNLTEIGRGAFSGCTGLINLTVDSGNMNYKAVDNIIYTKNGKTLVAAAGGLKTVSILNTITTIDGSAFEGAKLESIDLSALTSLTKINDSTFKLCTSLTEVKLPVNLTKIESSAFDGCTSLTGVLDLSALTSLTEIRGSAFNGCTGLAEVKLPASLTKIYPYAFSYCTSLTSAVFADKNGWAVYNDYKYENKAADIQQSDLDDPSKAAKYLRESTYNGGYCDTYWKRN